ncbi:MAG TPA: hypothetical protein VM870_04305, partial [Pyrinomonadaceae bacterium]|nr:hypothetical protein [Pyrinomonadaceae bacterium]
MAEGMNQKRIVLLSSRSGAAPNPALLEAARLSDVIAVPNNGQTAHARTDPAPALDEGEPPFLAVLYEIAHEVSTDELRQAVAQVNSTWSGVPVIAYHPYDT